MICYHNSFACTQLPLNRVLFNLLKLSTECKEKHVTFANRRTYIQIMASKQQDDQGKQLHSFRVNEDMHGATVHHHLGHQSHE